MDSCCEVGIDGFVDAVFGRASPKSQSKFSECVTAACPRVIQNFMNICSME